jgi:hypothetical protein
VIDYRAIAEKWLRETPEGGRALDALGRRLVSFEAEQGADSDQARAAAQAEAMAADRNWDVATGRRDLRRRRMLAQRRSSAGAGYQHQRDTSALPPLVRSVNPLERARTKLKLATGVLVRSAPKPEGNRRRRDYARECLDRSR